MDFKKYSEKLNAISSGIERLSGEIAQIRTVAGEEETIRERRAGEYRGRSCGECRTESRTGASLADAAVVFLLIAALLIAVPAGLTIWLVQ